MSASARSPRRWLATLMALLTGLGPIATPSYAALTKLADEPLNVKNSAKPNIVLTADDSTSMLFDFLPDYIIGTFDSSGKVVKDTFCRDATGKMSARCGQEGMLIDLASYPGGNRGKYISPGYIYQQFGFPYPAFDSGVAAWPSGGFDASGPGEGCDRAAPRCNGGIDPGASPGIANYPANTAFAGTPYEYWLLWPAPVHNSALNHLYYNPRLTYEPPAKADGTRYDAMDATNSDKGKGPWTAVPADPWAGTPVYVDLTTKVQVGQWCNSDWTQGINSDTGTPYATDPAYCRSNGTVALASSPKADGDYTYPWAWPGGTAPKDAKYFYPRNTPNVSGVTPSPNDNILWCDATSASWPANGALTVPQACNGYVSRAQTCNNATAQVCAGQAQTCANLVSQTCSSQNQTCNNVTLTQTCNNSQTQTCKNITSQTCNNSRTQTCANVASQTCNGYQAQTCTALTGQSCNGYVPPSCTNIKTVCTPPPPSSCTTTLGPPGCGGPEGPVCTPTTTCPPDTCVTSGTCASNGAVCTSDANCTAKNGACSISGLACQPANAATQCPASGHCSVNTGVACTSANAATQCPAINGACSKTGLACQPANAATQCPATGNCSVNTGVACTTANAATTCPTINGTCSKTGAACTAANASTTCPATGNCSVNTGVACTSANAATACPTINGACTRTGAACTTANQSTTCPTQGQCSRTGALCTAANAATTCPPTAGTCSATGAACTTANAATNCPAQGKCSITSATCTAANAATACPVQSKKCSITGAACSTVGTDLANCPDQGGTCSITGLGCTNANAATNCPVQETFGTCSVSGAACGGTKGTCPNTAAPATAATCSTLMNMGSKSLLEDANSTGIVCRRNNKAYADISAGRFNYPSGKYTTAVTGGLGAATIWVEDAVPTGGAATGDEPWTWVSASPAPFSGGKAHQSVIRAGSHQHYFTGASTTMKLNVGDYLFTYVYLDPANPPSEVMLQWYDSAGSWEHRAYWGTNLIAWGSDGTNSRRFMGALPPTGQWVRLAVSAAQVGLEGATVTGMAYTLYNGRATWDYAGSAASAAAGDTSTMDACAPTPAYTTVPRHYWKTEVEWCNVAVGNAGDKWNGYGDRGGSGNACQPFHDPTHVYPRFYAFGTAATTDNYSTPAFQRVDLDIAKRASASAIPTHTWLDDEGNTQSITRSFDEEMTNYANWFAYYRTRIQAVKTVTSLVFKELDDTYRVGFHTLSNADDRPFVNVADFDASQKTAWFNRLFGLTIALRQETPNLDAMIRVGDYYKDGGNTQLKGSTDPIVLSCQKNWHMLFTDGLTNQGDPPSGVGDLDNTVPSLPRPVPELTATAPWPAKYRENAVTAANSAADYATFYWITDLRAEGAVNGTTKAAVGDDNVPTSDADPAPWQHVNFAAISLGTDGKLPSGNTTVTESQLADGSLTWPATLPSVNRPDESGVDDLWHAAVISRGRFVNAQSADELRLGMGAILQDIANQAGSRAGVAFQNVNLSSSNKYIYRVGFEPGWGGTLTKVEVDPFTGNELAEVWRAAKQLNDQVVVVPGVKDKPWYSERKIATLDSSGKQVPFLWDNLAPAQQNALSQRSALEAANATRGKSVLEFLRGSQQREGIKLNQFRQRKATVLGDIADSQAIFTGPPNAPYLDSNDPGYSTFKAKYADRPARLFVGANDGMVHAFDDATGNEAWAYVPLGIYRTGSTGPGALSLQSGALPAFQHHFYVDSSPRIVDADLGSGNWRSVMVGGLGKGGRSYYAIDVTNPASVVDEISLAKNVLWEFSDPDMGYSYGRPMITKTRGFGGKWLAIVPTGYNNASGEGKVFFIDLASGSLLKTMSTGAGDSATPSGLAHIAGYTRDYRNQLTEQVYAGDLLGNLWRFDVSDPNPSLWKVEQLATLTDPSGTRQPVTTPPQIEVDVVNGVDRWVFVGTGKLYHNDDLKDTQIQTMYAIRDGTTTLPAKITSVVTRDTLDPITEARGVTGLDGKPDLGWFDDLPAGQRIVVAPQAALSVVAYSAVLPQDDPCLTGQPSRIYARGYERGDSLVLDEKGVLTESIASSEGAVGVELLSLGSASQDDGSVPNIVVGITLGTTGKLRTLKIQPPTFLTAHRMSWRLLGN